MSVLPEAYLKLALPLTDNALKRAGDIAVIYFCSYKLL